MNVLALPSKAVDRSLRLMRLPIDRVVSRDNERTAPIALAIDRADAGVRRIAGRMLHDDVLKEDARQRELAANERQRAIELRIEAELRARRADNELQTELDVAKSRREQAARQAEANEKQAEDRRRVESRQAKERTEAGKAASREAAERAEALIEEQARKERLTELEHEAEVLQAKDETLTATSEAQRLQRAASEVKSERKSS